MDEDMKIKCKGCDKIVSSSDMGHDSDNNLLCNGCIARGPMLREAKPERSKPEKIDNGEPYKCSNCGYEFMRVEGSKQNERCPYCSSDAIVADDKSAQKLIDGLDDFEDQKFFKE